jgi:hypothetical protein
MVERERERVTEWRLKPQWMNENNTYFDEHYCGCVAPVYESSSYCSVTLFYMCLCQVKCFFLWWRAPQQVLRTHRSLEVYCATLWWRRFLFFFVSPCNGAPVPVPLCPPQIPHGLTWDRTWASAMRGRWSVTWYCTFRCTVVLPKYPSIDHQSRTGYLGTEPGSLLWEAGNQASQLWPGLKYTHNQAEVTVSKLTV